MVGPMSGPSQRNIPTSMLTRVTFVFRIMQHPNIFSTVHMLIFEYVCKCNIQLRKFESDAITRYAGCNKYKQSLNENNFPAHYIHDSLNFIVFPFCRSITYAHNGTHHPHLFRIPVCTIIVLNRFCMVYNSMFM